MRSLVLGVLVGDQPNVLLHLGFRPGRAPQQVVEGHAWVTLDGINISETHFSAPDDGYVSTHSIPIWRH